MQTAAFKKGFAQVLPIETLRIFTTSDGEIENLVCGVASERDGAECGEWRSEAKLAEVIVTAHGYQPNSRAFRDFLRYLCEMEPKQRPKFLRFITGSPRLPIGGFAALDPRLTIVLKKPLGADESPDSILPSVMTC